MTAEAGRWLAICSSDALLEGGDGVRFKWPAPGAAPSGASGPGSMAAFAVRVDGRARAYLNRCAHVAVELDWIEGRFLDDTGRYVICATHGATYEASSGQCAGGPCRGRGGLVALRVDERDGIVWVGIGDAGP